MIERNLNNLNQDKLNALGKQRSNIFAWRGQFTPEFVSYLLDEFASCGFTIGDPFSGSGTVAVESLAKGFNCITYEINPSAYFMTSFYNYCKLSLDSRNQFLSKLIADITPIITSFSTSIPVYLPNEKDYRNAYYNLIQLAKNISDANFPESYLPFLLNVLFRSEKDKKLFLRDSFRTNFNALRNILRSLPESTGKFDPHLGDARLIGEQNPNSLDLIITSPPYINVFNYHQNYRGIIESFNYDILKIAHSEIGSNRKNRVNRLRTVVEYAIEIGSVLNSCSIALKNHAKIILVVGRESMVRKTPFYNSKIILDLLNAIPSFSINNVMERKFTNRYGENIFEDIIIAEKISSDISNTEVFKTIGLSHIENALSYASEDVLCDIKDVLQNNSSITESKIYK